jgi:hypothetical protein
MSPDLVNLQKLDGKLFRIKYLVILRNVTDTAMSAFRRNFFSEIDTGLRTVEHTMIYIQAALQGVPCHQIFLAHYEHVLHSPHKYMEPLAKFMELNSNGKQMLKRRLDNLPGKGKFPNRKLGGKRIEPVLRVESYLRSRCALLNMHASISCSAVQSRILTNFLCCC